ncbi:MAG: LuxR C-terminal-related transcriptional regulator [Ilumatobacteraceae bacterium]
MPDAERVLRVRDRIEAARRQLCVGRVRERDRLTSLLAPGGPAVVHVHGAPGIGKSVLVDAVVGQAGRPGIRLDARRVEPTPASFLSAAGSALDAATPNPAALGDVMLTRGISLLVVDGGERLRLIDDWLRDHLVPALPAESSTIIVARTPPNSAWRTGEWRHLAAELEIGPMTEADAAALVERRIGSTPAAAHVLRFGHGHPLALDLAADVVARRPDVSLREGPPPEVVEELVSLFLDELPEPTRAALEDVSLLRRVTRPLLAAVCVDLIADDIDPLWQALRELPYVTTAPVGLELDRVVQDAIATNVELQDADRARRVRQRAGHVAMDEADRAPGWESTADLLHLVQNPIIRDAFSPPPGQDFVINAARPCDREAIDAMVVAVDGEGTMGALDLWWSDRPDAFRVLRGADDTPRGVAAVAPYDQLSSEMISGDPVLAHIGADLTRRPLSVGGRALVVRRVVTVDGGESPSNQYAALIVDLKRTYLELRPALMRVYVAGRDHDVNSAVLDAMGFTLVPGDVVVGEHQGGVWALEFGPKSVDGWLARHVEIETSARSDAASVVPDGATVASPSSVRTLSAREREVLAALALGLTNRELATRLFISERTANRHLSNIFVKLGVRNRTEAARVAVAAGLG